MVQELSRLFLADIGEPQPRQALEAASVTRRVTPRILGVLLTDASPHDAHERLRTPPFVQADRDGLHIHDAVREAIAATLNVNDPHRFRSYQRSAYRHLLTELRGATSGELWRCTADLLYLLQNPVIRQAFFPRGGQDYAVEPARPQDETPILDIIERHEHPVLARYLRKWLSEAPNTFSVTRDASGAAAGFIASSIPLVYRGSFWRKIQLLVLG